MHTREGLTRKTVSSNGNRKTKENAETQRARRNAEKDKGNSVEARFLPFYIQTIFRIPSWHR